MGGRIPAIFTVFVMMFSFSPLPGAATQDSGSLFFADIIIHSVLQGQSYAWDGFHVHLRLPLKRCERMAEPRSHSVFPTVRRVFSWDSLNLT
jgi:hypothetical protein